MQSFTLSRSTNLLSLIPLQTHQCITRITPQLCAYLSRKLFSFKPILYFLWIRFLIDINFWCLSDFEKTWLIPYHRQDDAEFILEVGLRGRGLDGRRPFQGRGRGWRRRYRRRHRWGWRGRLILYEDFDFDFLYV